MKVRIVLKSGTQLVVDVDALDVALDEYGNPVTVKWKQPDAGVKLRFVDTNEIAAIVEEA